MANILSIGQSALNAAQVGLNTTGHNIANANTPGFSRQVVVQTTAVSQAGSFGFIGKGTEVSSIQRVYNQHLADNVLSAQTSQNELGTYSAQISQINNLFADSNVGLSPTLQEFFNSVQGVAADSASSAARQTLLSSAENVASKLQSMDAQLSEMRQSVNGQITSSVNAINGYAKQIAALNDAIGKAQSSSDGNPPNDLLDQRDLVISNLSKEIKVTVTKQGTDYGVYIGNGQPLVVGQQAYTLVPLASATDLGRIEVGYVANNKVIELAEKGLTGGTLGGLFEFRTKSLDLAQNSLGRIAVGVAETFNAQHQLGQDQNGALGGAFFNAGAPITASSTINTGTAKLSASITNANALTTSDYQVQFVGGNYNITRLSDGAVSSSPTLPLTVDGIAFSLASGAPAAGDTFLVKPTVAGAAGFNVAITDKSKIAAAVPIRSATISTNLGSGTISPGSIDATYTAATVTPAVTLSYNAGTNQLTGFPAAMPVTVTNNGVATVFAAGAPVTYTSGATISFGGASVVISGAPSDTDQFTIGPNTNGVGDNRNALLLGSLQTTNTLNNGTSTFSGAYGQLINTIGNKAHELQVSKTAEDSLLAAAVEAHQSNSGVNLDEEAANLMRYQQAYQAAGKVMATANRLFDLLLELG